VLGSVGTFATENAVPLALGAGALAGGIMQSRAAGEAADKYTAAAREGIASTENRFGITRGDLIPFISGGQGAFRDMASFQPMLTPGRAAELSQPFPEKWAPTQEWLESTPGYQFTRDQGLKAMQSSAAARGLGTSGMALKGAAEYTTGLADKTYGEQFSRYLQSMAAYLGQNQQIYNMLLGRDVNEFTRLQQRAGIGAGAAGTGAGASAAASQNIASLLSGMGSAQAAGTMGAANAIAGGLSGLSNNLFLAWLMNQQKDKLAPGSGWVNPDRNEGLILDPIRNATGYGSPDPWNYMRTP